MPSPELKPELQEMTHDQLRQEIPHAHLWGNERGVQYDILRRDDGTFDRIEIGKTEEGRLVFRVAMKTIDQWPVMREPTLSESLQFMDVAKNAFPESPITILLCELIASKGAYMNELAIRYRGQLLIKAALQKASLNAGKK